MSSGADGSVAESRQQAYRFESTWFEDDGISSESKAELCTVEIAYVTGKTPEDGIAVEVVAKKQGKWEPLWVGNGIDIVLPVGEERPVVLENHAGDPATSTGRDKKGRRVWHVGVTATRG